VCEVLEDREGPFMRLTMREVVEASCGFDILEALEAPQLAAICRERGLLEGTRGVLEGGPGGELRWDELFFALQVERVDPWLADRGAVFVTEWPAPLAILARRSPDDPRVAERFELYVDGVELANGFQELVDPVEQRARFEAEVRERRRRGLPELPVPERLLAALEDPGMPPSAGVALGVDRLLMLALGVDDIGEVLPFAPRRDESSGEIEVP
jgi:lysyl-tRNA synthetase class 2